MLLTDVLHDLYAPLTGVSERTVSLYGYTIRSWGDFLRAPPETTHLEELAVAQFLSHRVRTKAAATAAKDRTQIRAIWGFCARRSLCSTWPSVPRIVVPERVPEAWMPDEMRQLVAATALDLTVICGFPAEKVWRALLLLCYDTGERISAVMALRCSDVRGCSVLFRAENRKGRSRDILREISVETADALWSIRRRPEDTAIPWDRAPTHLWARYTRLLKRAGLPSDRRSKFHRIRKTTASFYEAACGPGSAQRLLGHASAATTRAYIDPRVVSPGEPAPKVLPRVV
jgi:integrase